MLGGVRDERKGTIAGELWTLGQHSSPRLQVAFELSHCLAMATKLEEDRALRELSLL